jgi:hypothetical protein
MHIPTDSPSLKSQCPAAGDLAKSTFETNKAIYHNIAVALITKDLAK